MLFMGGGQGGYLWEGGSESQRWMTGGPGLHM